MIFKSKIKISQFKDSLDFVNQISIDKTYNSKEYLLNKFSDTDNSHPEYPKNLKEQQQDIRDGKEVAKPIQDNIINEEKVEKSAPVEKKKLSYKEQAEFDGLEKEMEKLEGLGVLRWTFIR
mgnify:CR=1 FL=1